MVLNSRSFTDSASPVQQQQKKSLKEVYYVSQTQRRQSQSVDWPCPLTFQSALSKATSKSPADVSACDARHIYFPRTAKGLTGPYSVSDWLIVTFVDSGHIQRNIKQRWRRVGHPALLIQ